MKFAAEVDRRNARSHYDNLVVEVGNAIGRIDAKVEMLAEHLEGRLDDLGERLQGRLDGVETRLDNFGGRLQGRLDNIDATLKRLVDGA